MPQAPASSPAASALIWACLGLVLLFLYGPLVPPAFHSFAGTGGATGLFHNYAAIFQDERLIRALGLKPGGYFLYVSRLEPENHALDVREAFEKVRTDLKLALVGELHLPQPAIAGRR